MTTSVSERIEQLRADERKSAEQARRQKQQEVRERAAREVAAEQRQADEAARLARADQVEKELRSHSTPTVTIRTDEGREVVFELGASESIARGTQIEGVRRVCQQLSEAFRSRVVASRNAGEVMPPVDFLAPMLDSSGGLLQARRMGLVVVRDAR